MMSVTTRTAHARLGAALGALCVSLAAATLTTGSAQAASVATWDKVAQCESGGNWSINTGNGYYGGLQFSLSTWRAYGGGQYAQYPHQATKQQQILIGEKVLAGQGQGAWPTCGPRAGLGSDHATPYPSYRSTGVGVYRPGDQMFYEADRSGGVLGYNRFGVAKDVPLMGHWNAGPIDTMGIYRPSTSDFALSTDNATVWVNARFGNPGDIPVVGDWDGRGYTTIGVYRPTEQTFYLSNDNATVTHTIKMGNPGDIPIVGNWSGTGKTTIGVFRPGDQTFYLSNTNNAANVDHTIRFGNPGDIPIKGDWNGTGTDKVGVYRPDTSDFYGAGQDTNTVIFTMRFGNPGDQPITGNWS